MLVTTTERQQKRFTRAQEVKRPKRRTGNKLYLLSRAAACIFAAYPDLVSHRNARRRNRRDWRLLEMEDGRARDPLSTRACRPLTIASSTLVPSKSPVSYRIAEENIMRSCYGRGAPLRWAVYAACLSAFLFFGLVVLEPTPSYGSARSRLTSLRTVTIKVSCRDC